MPLRDVNWQATPWWSSRHGELAFRLCQVVETQGPITTDELLDHWLLVPYENDAVIRRTLTDLRVKGILVGRRLGRGCMTYTLGVPGTGAYRALEDIDA